MRFLGDFPVLRLGDPHDAEGDGFASAAWRYPAHAAEGIRDVGQGADAVLVLSDAIAPDLSAENVRVDEAFDVATTHIGFVARSAVTGLFIARGAILVPVAGFVDTLPTPAVTLPRSIGTYTGHATPEVAFAHGFASVTGQIPENEAEKARLALAASLGQDALNGDWWILGALSNLSGGTVGSAWADLDWLLDEPAQLSRQVQIEARKTRLTTGVPVRAISQAESRALKAMLPDWPESTVWRQFIEDCQRLGPAPAEAAQRATKAAARLWPDLAREVALA